MSGIGKTIRDKGRESSITLTEKNMKVSLKTTKNTESANKPTKTATTTPANGEPISGLASENSSQRHCNMKETGKMTFLMVKAGFVSMKRRINCLENLRMGL